MHYIFEMCLYFAPYVLRCETDCVHAADTTPKLRHILGSEKKGGSQDLKRDDEWVCEREWGKEESVQASFFLCVFMRATVPSWCPHMLLRVHLCVGIGMLPAVFFHESLSVYPHIQF